MSLPLAAGLPPLPRKKVGFALCAPFGRSVRKPFINGSKGEGQPAAVAAGCKEEKIAGVHAGNFFVQVSSMTPAANPPRLGVVRPPKFPPL